MFGNNRVPASILSSWQDNSRAQRLIRKTPDQSHITSHQSVKAAEDVNIAILPLQYTQAEERVLEIFSSPDKDNVFTNLQNAAKTDAEVQKIVCRLEIGKLLYLSNNKLNDEKQYKNYLILNFRILCLKQSRVIDENTYKNLLSIDQWFLAKNEKARDGLLSLAFRDKYTGHSLEVTSHFSDINDGAFLLYNKRRYAFFKTLDDTMTVEECCITKEQYDNALSEDKKADPFSVIQTKKGIETQEPKVQELSKMDAFGLLLFKLLSYAAVGFAVGHAVTNAIIQHLPEAGISDLLQHWGTASGIAAGVVILSAVGNHLLSKKPFGKVSAFDVAPLLCALGAASYLAWDMCTAKSVMDPIVSYVAFAALSVAIIGQFVNLVVNRSEEQSSKHA